MAKKREIKPMYTYMQNGVKIKVYEYIPPKEMFGFNFIGSPGRILQGGSCSSK